MYRRLSSSRSLRFLILLALLALFSLNRSAQAQSDEILVLEIEGAVTQAMATYFERGIETAENDGATAVLIILDTPGGAIDITQEIVQLFLAAEVPVIVYVGPGGAQAASAGSVITAAAHASGMAPGTVIGAASPIDGSGADIEETLYLKLTEDLKAMMRNLTARRGEEAVELAEAMIDEARAVTAEEALAVGFIDVLATDVPDLLTQLDGLTVEVNGRSQNLTTANATQRELSLSLIERLLHALSNPLFIGLLLTLGVQGILIELSNPGGWVAGFIGVVSLSLALYGLGTLPTNWFGLGLIVLAFVLFFMETQTPALGALAVAGVLTMMAGFLLLFNSPGSPEFARISLPSVIVLTASSSGFFLFVVAKVVEAQKSQPKTGQEGMLHRQAVVKKSFKPVRDKAGLFQGTVFTNGALWRAVASEALERDQLVLVEKVDGLTLTVASQGEN